MLGEVVNFTKQDAGHRVIWTVVRIVSRCPLSVASVRFSLRAL